MIKFESTLTTFTEVPDEISFCINCTCCPLRCKGCFEPWLQENTGKELTIEKLDNLIQTHKYCTCICFMGGINDYHYLLLLLMHIKQNYPTLKTALYSGENFVSPLVSNYLDYYKIGPYIEEFGPLNKKTTNQKFFKKENNNWVDITYKFQK